MSSHAFRDEWVDFRSPRAIKDSVKGFVESCGQSGQITFNLVNLIERKLAPGLKIEFFDQVAGQPPAYVTQGPLTLHVDKETWSDAKIGDPRARYILAHEIGHLVLHRGTKLGFSEGPDAQLRAPPDERSAEWQANVFAHFLLVPDVALAERLPLAEKAADIAVDSWVIATVQGYDAARDIFEFVAAPAYEGDMCLQCGGVTLARLGTGLMCDSCGWAIER